MSTAVIALIGALSASSTPALIEIQKRWGVGDAEKTKKERPQPATV